jgi:hypothetical protein
MCRVSLSHNQRRNDPLRGWIHGRGAHIDRRIQAVREIRTMVGPDARRLPNDAPKCEEFANLFFLSTTLERGRRRRPLIPEPQFISGCVKTASVGRTWVGPKRANAACRFDTLAE